MEKVVSYFEHEENMVRMERANRRIWILCVILIVALLGTNAGWLYYESQWQVTETQIEAEQKGDVNIVGGGDVNYGTEGEGDN